MNAVHGYRQLRDAVDVRNARRSITDEQRRDQDKQQQLSPTPKTTLQEQRTHHHPLKPHRQHEWWRTEREPNASLDEMYAKQRQLQDDVRRQEQNAWLGKHAKQRRFEFSAEQKRMLRQWFNALDADGSGKISVEVRPDCSVM